MESLQKWVYSRELKTHCVKSVSIRSFFWFAFSRIRKTPNTDTFHAVTDALKYLKSYHSSPSSTKATILLIMSHNPFS